ncbi:disulfide oxidoreductase [Paraliobacillus quinghaiensis]|uniref:Disulfide oxidoreductase n=1 Tax=Paraliobacillus quinghaiensis TaxID=470815 RepID=A0A917TV39_9BACI|nr:DUF1462 family protein [Paraliobacillus quinghaiensis]GGM37204.1 disulfide oxidoreductase [Paraliobacillus quinghaiensis]
MVNLTVYGAGEICPSCVNAPSSKETYEWLQAAVSRKFPNYNQIQFMYVDIFQQANNKQNQQWINKIKEEELFYPVIVVDNEFISEGNPRIKTIYQVLEQKIDADA